MKHELIVWVGPPDSGRRSSLASVLQSCGSTASPLRLDVRKTHELAIDAGRRILAAVSVARTSRDYEPTSADLLSADIRREIGWLRDSSVVVFVLDSQVERHIDNLYEFYKFHRDLVVYGEDPFAKPILFLLNKRDLSNTLDVERMRAVFGGPRCRYVESVASEGIGATSVLVALNELMVYKP